MPRSTSITGAPPPSGGVQHLSYSGHSTYLECPKSFQLSRIQKAPEEPARWFVGGTAVHATTEAYDRLEPEYYWTAGDVRQAWSYAFSKAIEDTKKREPDDRKWRTGKSAERYAEGNQIGPEMGRQYIEWGQRSP